VEKLPDALAAAAELPGNGRLTHAPQPHPADNAIEALRYRAAWPLEDSAALHYDFHGLDLSIVKTTL
jgi:hypothetical protein